MNKLFVLVKKVINGEIEIYFDELDLSGQIAMNLEEMDICATNKTFVNKNGILISYSDLFGND